MPFLPASRLVAMLVVGVLPGLHARPAESGGGVGWAVTGGHVDADESRGVEAAARSGAPARLRVQQVVFALRPVPDFATGSATMEYRPYVLFADGRVREAFDDDPDLLDAAVAARLSAQRADQWGRWQRSARGLLIDWDNGARDRISEPVDATPASRTRLAGTYVERDSTFRTRGSQSGGSVLRFFADGRFERTPVPRPASREPRAGASAPSRGRYRIAAWTLTLMFDDGRREQRLFFRYPAASRMIGIGRASFMRDTTTTK